MSTMSDDDTLALSRDRRARGLALAAIEGAAIEPVGVVTYNSKGRVLVVGGEPAQWLAARIETPLHAQILLTEGSEEPGAPTIPLGGRAISIDGHLGQFVVELGQSGHHNHQRIETDLVLDLGDSPLIDSEIPPPGYWHFGTEAPDLDAAVLAVQGMSGTFEKPRFFSYDADICAHGRSGKAGCRRCIDSCPADAIISIGEQVEVNPKLCQGGGICASVCPTGAIRYAYPSPGDTAERVRTLLTTYLSAGGNAPVMMFASAEDAADLPETPPNVLLIALEELASVGHEIWLAALAWGARCVLLVDGGSAPPKAALALAQQVEYCQALLSGMQYDPRVLRLIETPRLRAECTPGDDLPEAAQFAASADKRQLATLALDHLWQHSLERQPDFALPPGAPYGEIRVDSERCTLCMACTSVCPAKALSAGDETPRLDFWESNCVQCGTCSSACPESAITLNARYLADPQLRRQPRTLNEEPPFCCVECGKPFATRRVIDNILGKLADHAMFSSERARRRLQMCEDCRVVDAVQDADAMQAGLKLQSPEPRTKQ